MKRLAIICRNGSTVCMVWLLLAAESARPAPAADNAPLPAEVRVVWDLKKAHRETTPTRERVCINGLWRWQPADES